MSRKSSNLSAHLVNSCKDDPEPEEETDENNDKDEGIQMEVSSKGTVKGSVSWNYLRAGAHWSILFTLFMSFLLVQFLASGIDYWVSVWYVQTHF